MIEKENLDSLIAKLKQIKALISDVDGVLTDGKVTYSSDGNEIKSFNVKDGQIVRYLKDAGILTGVITGRSSTMVERRCTELKFDFFHQGVNNKLEVLEDELHQKNILLSEVCYIGDDINDLSVLQKVGIAAVPNDAVEKVKGIANYISAKNGGDGVFRDVANLILKYR